MDNNGTLGKDWYKPSEIAERMLIVNTKGKPDYHYVLRLIKGGHLQAKNLGLGKTPYFVVSAKEIQRFNALGGYGQMNYQYIDEVLIEIGDSFYWEGALDADRWSDKKVKLSELNIAVAKNKLKQAIEKELLKARLDELIWSTGVEYKYDRDRKIIQDRIAELQASLKDGGNV